jgi:glycyl-tRNA synthetase alpha chain
VQTFQQVILTLQDYWDRQGCALLQPYDMEVGAGTSHTATFLRAIGPRAMACRIRSTFAAAERWPLRRKSEPDAALLSVSGRAETLAAGYPRLVSRLARALGFDLKKNDVRFVEDDWENPTLGAWGLGWEVWLNGMEVTQFTYFPAGGRTRLQSDHRRDYRTDSSAWRCICRARRMCSILSGPNGKNTG